MYHWVEQSGAWGSQRELSFVWADVGGLDGIYGPFFGEVVDL